MAFYSSHKVNMFDFLSNEVFQIVVITALFVIGVMLFMLYKRPSENISQYLDDIDYRIDKMNKKLDDLTNTFVNGLIVDEDETDVSSTHEEAHEETAVQEAHEETDVQEAYEETDVKKESHKDITTLNYDGIEFSDIPNFSTDTSVINDGEHKEDMQDLKDMQDMQDLQDLKDLKEKEEKEENLNVKKKVNIIKRIIQSEE